MGISLITIGLWTVISCFIHRVRKANIDDWDGGHSVESFAIWFAVVSFIVTVGVYRVWYD